MKKEDVPPTYKLAKGYQAMFFSARNRGFDSPREQGWIPLSNCWGYPYVHKGNAINKCVKLQGWRYYSDAVFQVIELHTGKIVWQSENLIELGFNQ